jgi:methionyl aminopeptidase
MARTVNYRSDAEIALVRESSLLVGKTLAEVARHLGPGVTTQRLDQVAEEFIRDHGAEPAFKGYHGFPATLMHRWCMGSPARPPFRRAVW